jgi:hypothetical protein
MKKILMAVVAVLFVGGMIALAEDAAAPKTVDVQGKVAVVKDDAGAVKEIKVTAGEKAYTVKLDDAGKKVAESDGKTVKLTGTVDDKNVITVTKVSAVEEKKAE